jgi:hypothetical protein
MLFFVTTRKCRVHLELNSFSQKKKQGKRSPSRWVTAIKGITPDIIGRKGDVQNQPWRQLSLLQLQQTSKTKTTPLLCRQM